MQTKIKTEAARRALLSRVTFGYPLDKPCDVFELVAKYGLSLRFTKVASLDGMYIHDGLAGSINVSGLRPSGLQRFTTAHELGHFIFGHGAKLDKSLEEMVSDSADEETADTFARHLLMPKRAVLKGFTALGSTPASASPMQYHAVASWLGVGYTTLVQQCRWTLGLIRSPKLHELTLRQPQQIKRAQVPSISWTGTKELWPITPFWTGSRVHIRLGDVITGLQAPNLEYLDLGEGCAIASKVGHFEVEIYGGGYVHLSIAKAEYTGMYQYRYLEDDDDA